jgi:multiple sugar transport system permease protein
MSFRFVPVIALVIPLYVLYQRLRLYNTHSGLIFACRLIILPFTIRMLRSFFLEVPSEIQDAAKIDGCSWLGVLTRVILPLNMPGISVTVSPGFIFCRKAFNYPLILVGRQTFPVTVGAIQLISYEQVLWGQMAAATIVSPMPQLVLSLMVQKHIVRCLTMGAVR